MARCCYVGSGNDTVTDSGTGAVNATLGLGNDTFTIKNSGPVNLNYQFNSGQSNEGQDTINGFRLGEDSLTLNGVSSVQVNSSAKIGTVITDGTNDGWSVTLVGVHYTEAQLVNAGSLHFV